MPDRENQTSSDNPKTPKRPYVKPEFRYEVVFETLALSCGKVSPIQAQCRFNSKNS